MVTLRRSRKCSSHSSPWEPFFFLCRDYIVWFTLDMVFPTRNVGEESRSDGCHVFPAMVCDRTEGSQVNARYGQQRRSMRQGRSGEDTNSGRPRGAGGECGECWPNMEALAKPNKRTCNVSTLAQGRVHCSLILRDSSDQLK